MIKVFVYVAKIVVSVITAMLMLSCSFGKRVDGSGNVVTQQRPVNAEFTSVSAGSGLEVIIEQGSNATITVEADDNLHQHIKTEIKDGELDISADVNIGNAEARRVVVRMPEISAIESSSGASVKGKNTVRAESIDLSSGSGSVLAVTVDAVNVRCETASGSSLTASGKAEKLETESSSGSSLDAKGLASKKVSAQSSSGSSTIVNPSESLKAEASSGSRIKYVKTPSSLDKKTSSGGEVAQQ